MKRRFEVGQTYDFTDWFTGKIIRRLITSVGEGCVWITATCMDPKLWDGKILEDTVYESRIVLKDENDDEYILLYIYQDNEARIYADMVE